MTDVTDHGEKMNARAHTRVAALCIAGVCFMVGMAYAAVPLYDLFCRVTGYGGTTQAAEIAPSGAIDRVVTVRFDANERGLGWDFRPGDKPVTLKVGEVGEAVYLATNNDASAAVGTSTFNVTPQAAGAYFNKLDCFCFTEQPLAAGETAELGVVFFVDPAIDEDPQLESIKTITLSYTFYPAPEEDLSEEARAFLQERNQAL